MENPRPAPSVGVVTVLYNSQPVLTDFLESLAAQEGVDVRLYAVDNASPDEGLAVVHAADLPNGEIVVLENSNNLGVAEGNNVGLRRALADGVDWILLLNNDTEFPPDLIRGLIDVATSHDRAIVAPVIEGDSPRGSLWYGGGHWRPWRGFQAAHERFGSDFARSVASTGIAQPTQYAPTCCLLVRPDVFAEVGLMDPSYFVYFDDVDFAIRCTRAGFPYAITSRTTLFHKAGGTTGGAGSPFTIRWDTRNWVLVARRFSTSRVQLVVSLLYISLIYTPLQSLRQSIRRRGPWRQFILRERAFLNGLRADLDDHAVPPLNW